MKKIIQGKLRLIASARCFFPKGAFFYSTGKIARLAKQVGYEGVEFLPTWRFIWEMKRYGRLLAPRTMVASGHRDWRFDRVREAQLTGRPWWWYQLKNKEDWLFPLSSPCLRTLQEFQKKYEVPVTTQWFEDTRQFSPVILELWSAEEGIDQNGLLKWLKEDPEKRGVVVDTAKFTSWCWTNDIKKERTWSELEPYIWEVHYRIKEKYMKRIVSFVGWLSDDSTINLEWILKENKWRGKVVVEFGFPDLKDSPFGLVGEDIEWYIKLHKNIIDFVRRNAQ